MSEMKEPTPGDFTAWIVGWPGPDTDYALCVKRDGDRALLRFQVWQQPGPWHEDWIDVYNSSGAKMCWATRRIDRIGQALKDERARLFPDLATQAP